MKEQYPRGSANPATAKYVGRSNGTEPDPMLAGAPLPVPTAARPGTDEKIAVLAARVARGEQPFHPLDGRTVRRVIVTPATDE